MKYIKSFENTKNMSYTELMNYRKIKNYTPTEKLLHLLADEIYSQWEIIKEDKDGNNTIKLKYGVETKRDTIKFNI